MSVLKTIKRLVVAAIGRDTANRLSGPYHDGRARRRTREFLDRLPGSESLVNVGCGLRPLANWINLDIARGDGVDVVWNIRRGLPFQNESCSAIFCEHVIEHLTREDGFQFLRECHRVLQKEGVVRLSTPDAGKYLNAYSHDQEFLNHPSFAEQADTPMDRINMMMREEGLHLWCYDADSLSLQLKKAGFSSVMNMEQNCSQHPRMMNIDSADRAFESLYLEAVK